MDYANPQAKRDRLSAYFDSVRHTVTGKKERVAVADLALDLAAKAAWLRSHLRKQEWIQLHAAAASLSRAALLSLSLERPHRIDVVLGRHAG